MQVHRGFYEAAKVLYDQFLPLVEQHLSTSPFAKITFAVRSLLLPMPISAHQTTVSHQDQEKDKVETSRVTARHGRSISGRQTARNCAGPLAGRRRRDAADAHVPPT